MLYNKVETLVHGTKFEIPGHATAICFYVSGDTATLDVSPDGTNWYSIASVSADSVTALAVAYPFVKYEQGSASTIVQLGICTHKHGS